MSVDTITRVNAYFKAQIEDIFPVYTIYDNDNLGLPESSDGPMVKLFVEPAIDNILTDNALYQEDGVIIAQIFVEIGESSLILHQIADDIKTAFRQVTLEPTFTTENSAIQFEDIEFANAGTVAKESGGNIEWKRWDVFVTYSKYDCQTSPFFVSTWDTENLGGTGSPTKTIILPMSAGNLVDWGDGTIDNTNTHEYASGGVKTIRIDGEITGFRFNNIGDKSKLLTVSNTGGLVIDGNGMFFGCDNLSGFLFSESVVSTTSNFVNYFRDCESLIEIDLNEIGQMTNMVSCLRECNSLTTIIANNLDTSLVTTFSSMCNDSFNITDFVGVEDFIILNVANFSNFLNNVTLPTSQYSTLLINYEAQLVQNNVSFSGGNSKFSSGAAATARQALIDDHNWTITDGGPA